MSALSGRTPYQKINCRPIGTCPRRDLKAAPAADPLCGLADSDVADVARNVVMAAPIRTCRQVATSTAHGLACFVVAEGAWQSRRGSGAASGRRDHAARRSYRW